VNPAETVVNAVITAFGRAAPCASSVIGGASFSCDLGIHGEVGGMPSILLGPRGGNLHAPDEWVEIQDLLDLTGIYATLAVEWCGNNVTDSSGVA